MIDEQGCSRNEHHAHHFQPGLTAESKLVLLVHIFHGPEVMDGVFFGPVFHKVGKQDVSENGTDAVIESF